MADVFRLYAEGPDTYQGWFGSPAYPYNKTNRGTIDDPDGSSAKKEITSIPSPFARIDLVKTAFGEVCGKKDLDGNTIFHKMVSDALDIGEIFFNIDKFKDNVEVITWDVKAGLNRMANSSIDPAHKLLADALQKYLIADSATYNFGKMQNIYILNYKNGKDALNIIGATSPATLFFSNANDLGYIGDGISFGQDKPFDDDYQPLYKRDFDYVRAWFSLRAGIPQFSVFFPELDKYLDLTLSACTLGQRQTLKGISANEPDFVSIGVTTGQQTNIVDVLGYQLLKKQINIAKIDSDFQIEATKPVGGKLLVLPVSSGNKYADLQYVTDKWGNKNAAPYYDNNALEDRALPFEGTPMPYLTIDDFMEDYIVRVPHSLNDAHFFDGNINKKNQQEAFLLPIKPLFFKYFTAEDLMGQANGTRMIEMDLLAAGSVKVFLRIPIKGNGVVKSIEYSRIYYTNNDADRDEGTGGVRDFKFTGLVMPFVKFNNPADAVYSVVCTYVKDGRYTFRIGENETCLNDVKVSRRNSDWTYQSETYTVKGQNFSYIEVHGKGVAGIIIPKFKKQQTTNTFKFAVDLGTSNTHIEVEKNGNQISTPFAFKESNSLGRRMFEPTYDSELKDYLDLERKEDAVIDTDIIPKEVGKDVDFHFPMRTVLSLTKEMNPNQNTPFGEFNIPMTYEKRSEMSYNDYKCDVKWGDKEDQELAALYIDCIMLTLRNYVLTEGGALGNTQVTWFYPSSMPNKRLTKLRNAWNDAYAKYFGDGTTCQMSESYAPIQYYYGRYSTATNLVNIDIGGGTTDIAYSKDRKTEFSTSFRFAANALFENPYAKLDTHNGIIDFHKDEIKRVLEENELGELVSVYSNDNNKWPSNMASFLFSLGENSLIAAKGVKGVDLNKILQGDDNFRIIFLLFYTAIIYHTAKIVKLKKLDIPRHVSLGGNGSKVVRIITTDSKLLGEYTLRIFEEVMGEKCSHKLEILGLDGNSSPKESTCKGGLQVDGSADCDVDNVVMRSNGLDFISGDDTYKERDSYIGDTIKSVDEFFTFFFNLNKKFDFDNNFGVNKDILKNIVTKEYSEDMMTFLKKGIELKMNDVDVDDRIEETFFFYPIKGIINALSAKINEYLSK